MKLLKKVFVFAGLYAISAVSLFASGTPHTVSGTVGYQSGGSPASATFSAYITSRPGEILTQSSGGCGYSGGYYWVQVGNFSTSWANGDQLKIDISDGDGSSTSGTITLSDAVPSQTKNLTLPDPAEPDISISPTSKNYGDVDVGSSSSQTFTVSNDGDADLDVSSVSLSGTNANQFSITSGGGSFSLSPGGSRSVVVQFVPTSEGSKSATLSIASNDPDEATKTAALSGTGIQGPDIDLDPGSASFGSVVVAGGSEVKSFTVSNDGNDDLNVSGSSLSGTGASHFSITSGGGSFSLSPGSTHTIQVTYNPSSAGSHSATLTVSSDDPDEATKTASLTGTGTEPDIGLSPTSKNYGDVIVDQTSSETFVVSNDGDATLNVSSVSITGTNANQFSITSGGGSFTLSPSGTRNVVVQFAPTSEGSKSATLSIASDDPDEATKTAALSGSGVVVPDIAISPTSKNYGNVAVGATGSQTFTVSNTGNGDLSVSSVSLTGTNADQFSITSGGGAFTLSPAGTRSVTVQFAPISAGSKSATLRIASDDPDENPKDVALSGTGVVPDIDVTPSPLAFGNVVVGGNSTETITVSNAGEATLSVTSTGLTGGQSTEFSITSGGGSFTLEPGATRSVQITFAPTSTGAKSTTLRFASNDPDENPKDVTISGTGAVPDIAVSPTSYDYGSTGINTSENQTFEVSNEGAAALSVSSTSLVGTHASEFSIVSGGGAYSLEPGATRSVTIRFTPLATGAKTATLRIASNDPDEATTDVALSGEGIEVPDISLSPTTKNFGNVTVGETASQSFTISNSGTTDLNVTSTGITGTDANQFSITSGGGSFTLASGGSQPITVKFQPGSVGLKSASLSIVSNDPDENPKTAALTGTGTSVVDPDIAVSPETHDFGELVLGSSQSATLVVTNQGDADLAVSSVTLIGTNADQFSIASGGDAFTLVPQATYNVEVQFAPTAVGVKNAQVRFASNDPNENPKDVAVSGTGIVPDIAVTPASKNYGFVAVDAESLQTFTISNEGTAPLSITAITLTGDHADQFAITQGAEAVVLNSGETHPVIVAFRPLSAGAKNANLQIASDDPDENPLLIPLTGNDEAPDIAAVPAALAFGDVAVGDSASLAVSLQNEGTATLEITNMAITGAQSASFSIENGGDPVALEAGQSVSVTIKFKPGILSLNATSLQVSSDDPDENPFLVPLSGTGILLDEAAPYLARCFPPPGGVAVPVNTPVQLRICDAGYGVDRSTLNVTVQGVAVVTGGVDQTGGLVTMTSHTSGYTVKYTPASNFAASSDIAVAVSCHDLAVPANDMDTTYHFTTGTSTVTQTKEGWMNEAGGEIADEATGISIHFPEGAIPDTLEITIGLVETPPALPDTVTGVGWIYHFGPSGILFQKIVTVAVPYTSADLQNAGVSQALDLPIYYFMTHTGEWVKLAVVDANEYYVFVEVTGFCYLAFGREPSHTSDVPEAKQIPVAFALDQNYPNPFNPETHIAYELPQKSHVWIGVFDVLGRQVSLLVDHEMEAGHYEAVWNGTNLAGQQVPSGVYFYRLETDSFRKTLKMILMR